MTTATITPPSRETTSNSLSPFYAELEPLCLGRLREALDARSGLFRRQLRDGRWDETWGTEDLTSTAICLIGTHRAGVEPQEIGLDSERTLDALLEHMAQRRYGGGLGLVVWAAAVYDGPPLERILDRLGFSLNDPAEFVAPLTTMETAWLASGLLHESLRTGERAVEDAAAIVVDHLRERFESASGLMWHATAAAPLRHRLRRHIANFADQIYSVQALAFAALQLGKNWALEMADRIATRLVRLQGAFGQWWWHYDACSGRVRQAYPVFSVHQHGMAPMVLAALTRAGGTDFSEAVEAGRRWLRENALQVSLVDHSAGTIWRNVEADETPLWRCWRKARLLLGPAPHPTDPATLKINRETRPYEWAWCLHAAAIDAGRESAAHIV
ncbi:MAG: hypothetical protein KY476_11025 [Planctomycetes bacterium]|nr:hypothetical protein [Planctomycetota bacterium]